MRDVDKNHSQLVSDAAGDCHLWMKNHPKDFWQVIDSDGDLPWAEAIRRTLSPGWLPVESMDVENFLWLSLGEGRFGTNHWDLTNLNRMYWYLKPVLPGRLIQEVRSMINRTKRQFNHQVWPIDDRYAVMMWNVIFNVMELAGRDTLRIKSFWPGDNDLPLVLTHDVETQDGFPWIPKIAELEAKYGFHSSFNIVGNLIPLDRQMITELKGKGFEFGLHGWSHDSKPFSSKQEYIHTVGLMNEVLRQMQFHGHRSPLNLRHPEWMQSLEIEYDLSFFDTDPYEPIPGGVMTIWPFFIGHFVELPSTLVQDNTLFNLLRESTPEIWFRKVDFLRKYNGMALLNSHPEYLRQPKIWAEYEQFLEMMSHQPKVWNPLPIEIARWWQKRSQTDDVNLTDTRIIRKTGDQVTIISE